MELLINLFDLISLRLSKTILLLCVSLLLLLSLLSLILSIDGKIILSPTSDRWTPHARIVAKEEGHALRNRKSSFCIANPSDTFTAVLITSISFTSSWVLSTSEDMYSYICASFAGVAIQLVKALSVELQSGGQQQTITFSQYSKYCSILSKSCTILIFSGLIPREEIHDDAAADAARCVDISNKDNLSNGEYRIDVTKFWLLLSPSKFWFDLSLKESQCIDFFWPNGGNDKSRLNTPPRADKRTITRDAPTRTFFFTEYSELISFIIWFIIFLWSLNFNFHIRNDPSDAMSVSSTSTLAPNDEPKDVISFRLGENFFFFKISCGLISPKDVLARLQPLFLFRYFDLQPIE